MFAGPRATRMGTHEGSYAFGDAVEQAPEKALLGSNGNGEQKVLMVLLLFAAYMNLLINLMRAPEPRVAEAVQ